MSLHWYACISTNTCRFEMHHILLETDWWALPNASSIVWIHSAVCEILADKAFIATDVLISQSFVAAFVPPAYVQIALIWGFPVQLSLWKSVYWLWRYKLNEVCDTWDSTPSIACPEASVFTLNFPFFLGNANTGWLVIFSLSSLNALSCSIWICPLPTTTPKIGISSMLKLYFDLLKHRLCFSAIFKNWIVISSSSFMVLAGIMKSSI